MASPQRDNGYTPIANEIMDALMQYRIPGEQMQCLLCILRNTYGWSRKRVALSYNEIAQQTGLNRGHVYRAIKALSPKKVIGVSKSGDRDKQIFEFNKNYELWGKIKKKKPVSKKGYKTVSKKGCECSNTPIILKQRKQRAKKSKTDIQTYPDDFLLFWKKYPKKKSKGQALTTWNKLKKKKIIPSLNILTQAIENQAKEKEGKLKKGKFCPDWPNPSTWLNGFCWEDEIEIEKIKKPQPMTEEQKRKYESND